MLDVVFRVMEQAGNAALAELWSNYNHILREGANSVQRSTRLPRLWIVTFWSALLMLMLVTAPTVISQRYTFANYGIESGLTNVNVTALVESQSGVIWVGTQKGIFSADGSRFEQQTAFADAGMESPWAMSEDNEGRIWTVDGSHLVYLQNQTVHPVEGVRLHLLSVSGVALLRLPAAQDAIYLLHDSELQRISSQDHGKSWRITNAFSSSLMTEYPELHHLTSLVASHDSTVWAGCGTAICEIDLANGNLIKFGRLKGVSSDSWTNFLIKRSGEVWARGARSLERLPSGGGRFSPVSGVPESLYQSTSLSSLLEDPDGKVLMNVDEGVLKTDGTKWQILNQNNGLPQDEIEMMIFDHAKNLWLAPSGRGISRWRGYGRWEGWTKADGLSSNIVLGIAADQTGKKWIATQVGLDTLDSGTGRIRKLDQPLFRQLTDAVALGDHLWTGDSSGTLIDLNLRTTHTRVAREHLNTVYQIFADKEDRIWVCSPKGLDYFVPTDKWSTAHHVQEPMLPRGNAYGITEGVGGVLWVMTEKGMYRLDGAIWTAIPLPVKAGPFYNLMAAAAADGTLWVQSRHPTRIVHLKIQDRTASILSEFSDPTMQSENLGFMALDHRGWLWIESDRGLLVFNGMRWVRCNTEDGLLYDNADYPAFLADTDGSIWIGTSAGVSHLLHPEAIFNVPRPQLELAEIQLGQNTLREGLRQQFDLRRPALRVRLLSSDYNRASSIVYRYRLEGLESVWQETEEGVLRFAALAPGSYTFRVASVDRGLHETSKEHVVSFVVLEPWWNRPWIQLIELLLGTAFLFGMWRLSVHLLVMRQRELEAMVSARTSELEREKTDLLTARSALLEMTRRDSLTGLLNRAAIFDCMKSLCDISLTTGSTLAIVMADIDHFKRINDEYGHVVGDLAIRECADRITRAIRPHDFVGRYGGEELLILMPGLDPAISPARMEELRTAIAGAPIQRGAVELRITCSFGVAWMGHDPCALESLVNTADEALYAAKKKGRNRVEFAPGDFSPEAERTSA